MAVFFKDIKHPGQLPPVVVINLKLEILTESYRWLFFLVLWLHFDYVIMSAMASQITSLRIVYSSVYSGADQRKYQSSASMAFVSGIHRWLVKSPHKGPVTQKMFPFDDVIMRFHHLFTRSGRWCWWLFASVPAGIYDAQYWTVCCDPVNDYSTAKCKNCFQPSESTWILSLVSATYMSVHQFELSQILYAK